MNCDENLRQKINDRDVQKSQIDFKIKAENISSQTAKQGKLSTANILKKRTEQTGVRTKKWTAEIVSQK